LWATPPARQSQIRDLGFGAPETAGSTFEELQCCLGVAAHNRDRCAVLVSPLRSVHLLVLPQRLYVDSVHSLSFPLQKPKKGLVRVGPFFGFCNLPLASLSPMAVVLVPVFLIFGGTGGSSGCASVAVVRSQSFFA
jgi:hypothetical protein